ncbi:NAD-dependent epimerase/dehydratase family protein [Limosilactobacillus pontis]
MKILVTGANGYLGQGIVEELSQKSNVEVIATGRKVDRINVDEKNPS